MNHLLLNSPNDKPFGPLHPATDHLLSKAYSVIISDEAKRAYNESLAPEQARVHAIQEFDLQQDTIAAQAIVRSLQSTYQQHTDLAMLLVHTGTQPLKLIMDNVNESFITQYQKSLEEIRRQLAKQWEANQERQIEWIVNWIYELSIILKKEYIEGTNDLKQYVWKDVAEIIEELTLKKESPNTDFYSTLSTAQKETLKDVSALNEYIKHFSDTFITSIITNKEFTKKHHASIKKKNEATLLNCYLSIILKKNGITSNEHLYKIEIINELESTNQMANLMNRLKEVYRLGDLFECQLIPEVNYVIDEDVAFQFGKKVVSESESEDDSEDESKESEESDDESEETDDETDETESDSELEDESEDESEDEEEKIIPPKKSLKTLSERVKKIKLDTRKSLLQLIDEINVNRVVEHEMVNISMNEAREFFAKAAQRIFHDESITDISNKKQILNMLKNRYSKMGANKREVLESDYSGAMEELLAIIIQEQGWEGDQSYLKQWSEVSDIHRMHRFIDPEKEMYPIYIRETLLARQKREATDYYLTIAADLFPQKEIIDLVSLTRKELQAIPLLLALRLHVLHGVQCDPFP